jgi:hypothetical protein
VSDKNQNNKYIDISTKHIFLFLGGCIFLIVGMFIYTTFVMGNTSSTTHYKAPELTLLEEGEKSLIAKDASYLDEDYIYQFLEANTEDENDKTIEVEIDTPINVEKINMAERVSQFVNQKVGSNPENTASEDLLKKYPNYKTAMFSSNKRTTKKTLVSIADTLDAYLLKSVNNLDFQVPAIAVITQALPKFPKSKGAKLIGGVYALKNSDRLFISFTKMEIDNGKTFNIRAIAVDTANKNGIEGEVNNNTNADILSALGKGVEIMLGRLSGDMGVVQDVSSQALSKQSESIETRRLITVQPHQPFKVFFIESLRN